MTEDQQFLANLIDRFLKNPSAFKALQSPNIPDGSPIGSDWCAFN